MSDNSKIEWTDHTFSPWWGCSRVSPACRSCYADAWASRWGYNVWRRHGPRRMLSEANWAKPLKWNRDAERTGQPAKVFCASMADVFEDHPDVTEARKRLWGLIESTPWLTWQLLTKRPENIAGMVPWGRDWPPSVWIGASAETQRWADTRIPYLLDTPARVRFLSCEPLLGPIRLRFVEEVDQCTCGVGPSGYYGMHERGCGTEPGPEWGISWVIIGGESGPKARRMDLENVRSLVLNCRAGYTPVFVKQLGSVLGRELGAGPKGGDIDAFPDDLKIRQFPATEPVIA